MPITLCNINPSNFRENSKKAFPQVQKFGSIRFTIPYIKVTRQQEKQHNNFSPWGTNLQYNKYKQTKK